MAAGAHASQRQFVVGPRKATFDIGTSSFVGTRLAFWRFKSRFADSVPVCLTLRVSKSNLREQELGLHLKHFVPELKVPRPESLLSISGQKVENQGPKGTTLAACSHAAQRQLTIGFLKHCLRHRYEFLCLRKFCIFGGSKQDLPIQVDSLFKFALRRSNVVNMSWGFASSISF